MGSRTKSRIVQVRLKTIKDPSDSCLAFSDEFKMAQLTQSIRSNGMLQPLTVTKGTFDLCYTLVCGHRRFEAARRLGLEEVPAMVVTPDRAIRAALFENMFREQPSCFDTARLLSNLMKKQQIADPVDLEILIGINEQEIREKLLLLTLESDRIEICRAAGIDQDTATKIVSMSKPEQDRLFLGLQNQGRDLAETAWILRSRLGLDSQGNRKRTMAIKDVRFFYNTIENAVDIMKKAGIEASSERTSQDGYVEYIIRIPQMRTAETKTAVATQGA